MTGPDAAASLYSSISPSNLPLLSAFLACALAQFLKPFITWFRDNKWDSRRMLGSGGMPSSHSATVMALATAIGLQDGAGGSSFAISVVLACVVMYDATGIRLHAGQQAELLNQIVCELPPGHPVANVRPLRDSLGHTPLQKFVQMSRDGVKINSKASSQILFHEKNNCRTTIISCWDYFIGTTPCSVFRWQKVVKSDATSGYHISHINELAGSFKTGRVNAVKTLNSLAWISSDNLFPWVLAATYALLSVAKRLVFGSKKLEKSRVF